MDTRELAGLQVRLLGGDDGKGGGDGPMVVLLHGFGAPGDDLVALAQPLAVPPGTRFVFPEAPLSLPSEFGAGRAWWMLDMLRLQMAMMGAAPRDLKNEYPEGLPAARAKLMELLAVLEKDYAMDPSRLVLGGFSQGAMLCCDVALRWQKKPAGLALMSGSFICSKEWQPLFEGLEERPVLLSHGREDAILPFALAEELRDALVVAGAAVTWVPFDGGHGIAPSVLRGLAGVIDSACAAPEQ